SVVLHLCRLAARVERQRLQVTRDGRQVAVAVVGVGHGLIRIHDRGEATGPDLVEAAAERVAGAGATAQRLRGDASGVVVGHALGRLVAAGAGAAQAPAGGPTGAGAVTGLVVVPAVLVTVGVGLGLDPLERVVGHGHDLVQRVLAREHAAGVVVRVD